MGCAGTKQKRKIYVDLKITVKTNEDNKQDDHGVVNLFTIKEACSQSEDSGIPSRFGTFFPVTVNSQKISALIGFDEMKKEEVNKDEELKKVGELMKSK
jgi:hypothetical protein